MRNNTAICLFVFDKFWMKHNGKIGIIIWQTSTTVEARINGISMKLKEGKGRIGAMTAVLKCFLPSTKVKLNPGGLSYGTVVLIVRVV